MTSNALSVESYVADVPAERRAVIEKLRRVCRQNLVGYEECMAHGLPGYKRRDSLEVAFASQKQYIALYVMKKDVVDEFGVSLARRVSGRAAYAFRGRSRLTLTWLGGCCAGRWRRLRPRRVSGGRWRSPL